MVPPDDERRLNKNIRNTDGRYYGVEQKGIENQRRREKGWDDPVFI
jgi:hypothetical protein